MNYVDLHVHSTASDGSCTPSEVVKLCIDAGLSAFALTDHDTTAGYVEAYRTLCDIKKNNTSVKCELIPGIEISAGFMGRDIHILGLFIDPFDSALNRKMQECVDRRNERNDRMIAKFKEFGIELTKDELTSGNPDTVITRGHFGRTLVAKGYVSDIREAFTKYLNTDAPCYIPRAFLKPEEAINVILSAGGVPVLAHPLIYDLPVQTITELLATRLVPAGLKGIELMHSTNKGNDEDVIRGMASMFNLKMSGGSDFHGVVKPDIKVGVGRGNLRVPETLLDSIREAKELLL